MIDEAGFVAVTMFTEAIVRIAVGNVGISGWDTLPMIAAPLAGCLTSLQGGVEPEGLQAVSACVTEWVSTTLRGYTVDDSPSSPITSDTTEPLAAESGAYYDAVLNGNTDGAWNVLRVIIEKHEAMTGLVFLCEAITDFAVMQMARLAPDTIREVCDFEMRALDQN